MKWNNFRRVLCGALSATLLLSTSALAFERDEIEIEVVPVGEETNVLVRETIPAMPMTEKAAADLAETDAVTVTVQGASLKKEGSDTSLSDAEYLARLVQTPANTDKDVNFTPDASQMAAGETWVEYDYGKEVKIDGVTMVGWWPGAQAVKAVSFRYYNGTEWKDSDANVTVPWGVDASVNGPISIAMDLSQAVTCTKFRIVVHSTYTAWSSKCCMRSMMPRLNLGAQVKLSEAIAAAREVLNGATVGNSPFQYSQAVYDAFSQAVAAAQTVLDNSAATETELTEALTTLTAAEKTFLAAVNQPGKLSEPEITLHGLTTSSDPLVLVNGTSDFDFYSGADVMTDAYFEYNYVNEVKIYSIDFLGWWPKKQGIKTMSLSYYAGGEWHNGEQNVNIPWKSETESNGASDDSPNGEKLTYTLDQPIECSKLRIYVNAAYHVWSSKVCMRHMEPRGEVLRDIKSLYDSIRDGQRYVDGVLVGDRPGEFPQTAVDAFQAVVTAANAALEREDLTEAELLEQVAAVEAGLDTLIESQNPRTEGSTLPEVTVEGATVTAGNPFCMVDRQLATRLELTPTQDAETAVVLDYGKPYTLSAFTLVSDRPLSAAVKKAKLQSWDGSAWQDCGEWDVAYRGSVPNFEGTTLTLDQTATASRFRLVLLEGYGETYVINELLTEGQFQVGLTQLTEAVAQAQAVLAEALEPDSWAADHLRWKLTSATNQDFLAAAAQTEIDALCEELESAMAELAPVKASLSALNLSAGTLTPAFESTVYRYAANVSNSVSQVTVTATAAQQDATVTVKKGDTLCENGLVALDVGENVVTVEVVNGQTTTIYTVTVTRAAGGGSSSSGSRPSTPADTTKTETLEDGTTVITVAKPDGTVTETVATPDGAKTETVTTKDGDVTITVTDAEGEEVAKVELPATIPETETRFDDVPEGHWADEAIHNAAALKLVEGVGDNKFDPVAPMTRGALATVLHRLSSKPAGSSVSFADVTEGAYYTEGVAWAAKVGVVTGFSEDIFAPEQTITREQLATMLARYAKLIGLDVTADAVALDQFSDGDKTGSWAVNGVAWCVENGILQGKGGDVLDPTANVTRAEVAVMLDRFVALLK